MYQGRGKNCPHPLLSEMRCVPHQPMPALSVCLCEVLGFRGRERKLDDMLSLHGSYAVSAPYLSPAVWQHHAKPPCFLCLPLRLSKMAWMRDKGKKSEPEALCSQYPVNLRGVRWNHRTTAWFGLGGTCKDSLSGLTWKGS